MINKVYWKLLAGFIGALVLSILPMPELVSEFRPPWILLIALYLEYYLPTQFKLITLLIAGILLDVLLSTVIGEHAFALYFTTWIAAGKCRRFQFFSMLQQIVFIGFFCWLYSAVLCFIDAMLGFNYSALMPFASALLGMFMWPWIRLLGDDYLLSPITYR